MKKDKIRATIISYLSVILQLGINFLFTPILIKTMGLEEYGLYETINSLGATLLTMNFGVTAIVSRNIVKHKKNKEKMENFLSMSAIISALICFMILTIGFIATRYINVIYQNNLTDAQIIKGKYMFIYIAINLGIMSWHNYTSGIIIGYEKFSIVSFIKIFRQLMRVMILSILLITKLDAVSIVITDLIITIFIVIIEMYYSIFKIKVPIKYHYLDKKELKETFLFSIASIIQTIVNQINLSLDKVILGIMLTTNDVAIYSIGLLIVNVFVSILKIISDMYLPDATKLVLDKADGEKFTDLIISPGRIQCIIGCGVVFGFLLVGKEFLGIWVGDDFKPIWLSTSLMLIFTMLSYITSVANVIIDAMLKKMGRSLILGCTAIINIIVSVLLIKPFGYLGAAIGTSFSLLFGNLILLNCYYKKTIKINIGRMYKQIFSGILLSAVLSTLIILPVKILLKTDIQKFLILGIGYILLYCLLLLKIGVNKDEKDFVLKIKDKFITKVQNIVH